MKRRSRLYFLAYAVVLAANILIVLLHKESARVSAFSSPAVFLMAAMVVQAILSYTLRYKGNYLWFGRFGQPKPFASDKDTALEEVYINRFFLMLKVYCIAIPFYIPQIFLTSSYAETLWALAVFFFPQVVFVIMGIADTIKDVKEDRIKKEQSEQERLLQERREEQGIKK